MNVKKMFFLGLVSIGLFSCSDESSDISNENKEAAYFSLKLSFPEAGITKAGEPTTSDPDGDGYQTGLATEQKFQKVAVIIVGAADNKVTDYLEYTADDFAPDGNAAADNNAINPVLSKVNYQSKVARLVTKGNAKVYVFLNPSADVASKFAKDQIISNIALEMTELASADAITNGVAKNDNFLMGNATDAVAKPIDGTVKFPTIITVDVERAAVKLVENTGTAQFTISNTQGASTVSATLINYAYNNLNKRAFLLKNIETRGDAGAFAGAYVVDPNFIEANYKTLSPSAPWYGNDFFVIGNQDVTKTFKTTADISYSLENTMISNEQYQNKTTSIVYKANLTINSISNANFYTYKSKIYTSYAELRTVYNADYPAVTDAIASLFTEAEVATAYAKTGAAYTTDVLAINKKLADKGIRCFYQGVCYYNWMIKHWDQTNTLLGRMEFGVVRNNVYYLEVTNILNIGEPWIPGGPEDPNPDPDPDETEKASILVSINVLPWTVRYNNIEF